MLQRDRRLVARQRYRIFAFAGDVPAVARGDGFQQQLDAAVAFESWCAQVVGAESELLVFGADAPCLARFFTGGKVIGELLAARNRGALDGTGYGHGQSLAG
jgi:hypothetical protein